MLNWRCKFAPACSWRLIIYRWNNTSTEVSLHQLDSYYLHYFHCIMRIEAKGLCLLYNIANAPRHVALRAVSHMWPQQSMDRGEYSFSLSTIEVNAYNVRYSIHPLERLGLFSWRIIGVKCSKLYIYTITLKAIYEYTASKNWQIHLQVFYFSRLLWILRINIIMLFFSNEFWWKVIWQWKISLGNS